MENSQTATHDNQGGIAAAAFAGALVGSVIAAGVLVLQDKENREKIRKIIKKAKNKTLDYADKLQKSVEESEPATNAPLEEPERKQEG